MRNIVSASLLSLLATLAHAQTGPTGLWKTIDDETGKEKSLVRITETGGVLSGKIEKGLDPAAQPGALCTLCPDERKDKPMIGLQIIEGLKRASDDEGAIWGGGTILDPNKGKIYKVKLKPIDGGKQLEVRGYMGPFYRTQTWIRVE